MKNQHGKSSQVKTRLSSGTFDNRSEPDRIIQNKETSTSRSPQDTQKKHVLKKHRHIWALKEYPIIFCHGCGKSDKIENQPVRVLSMGAGVQSSFLLLKYYERYDVITHADIANGDREHGEYDIIYWVLDNIIKPFCTKHNIPLWIISHPKGGVFKRAMDEKKLPVISRRWCTQDHKIDLMTTSIRKGMNANFPDNVVISELGISYDEAVRSDGKGSKVKYNVLDYPLIELKVTRDDCIKWLNENHPIEINGNKIDWKDCKSGCWFCPYWPVAKLRKLSKKQKLELVKMEENSKHNLTFKKKPMKIIMGLDSHSLLEWTDEDEETDETTCITGRCFN